MGTYANIIKTTYNKLTAIPSKMEKKIKVFPLRSGTKQGCPLSPVLFNKVYEVLSRAIRRQGKWRKHIQVGKETKFEDDMTL